MVVVILTKEKCEPCKKIESSEKQLLVDVNSELGKTLVKLLNIKFVPAFIRVEQTDLIDEIRER